MKTIVKIILPVFCLALMAFSNMGETPAEEKVEIGKKHKELIVKVLKERYKGNYSKVSFEEITTKSAMKWIAKNEKKHKATLSKSNKRVLKKVSKKGQLQGYLITGIIKGKVSEILLAYNQTKYQAGKSDFSYWVITDGISSYDDDDDDDDDEEAPAETYTYGYAADLTSSAPFPPDDYGSGGACPCMAESVEAGEGGGTCATPC
jgi:hypothetical protein